MRLPNPLAAQVIAARLAKHRLRFRLGNPAGRSRLLWCALVIFRRIWNRLPHWLPCVRKWPGSWEKPRVSAGVKASRAGAGACTLVDAQVVGDEGPAGDECLRELPRHDGVDDRVIGAPFDHHGGTDSLRGECRAA
jgi:hypothetical protein